MDITAVKQQIQTKTLQDFYIFTGEEQEVMWQYIRKISEVSGKPVSYIESVQDIFVQLQNRAFVQHSFCYVVRDDADVMENEKLQAQLEAGLMRDNILIVLITTLDKRKKFYKQYKDRIVEFECLDDKILIRYIKQHIALTDENCQRLIDVCEKNYGRILLEIDKIKRTGEKAGLSFETLLHDGTIYKPPKDAIFDFVDAVLSRKVKTAFNLLQQSYAVGEATMVLLSVLYTNTKQLLQVQSCTSDDISKSTGLTPWQVKLAKNRGQKYSTQELIDMLFLIRETQKGIVTGRIDDSIAIEYILVNVL